MLTEYTITCDDRFMDRIDWYVEWTNEDGTNNSDIFVTKEDAEKFIAKMSEFEEECHRWHGKNLTGNYPHYCPDWDYLPIDSTCAEFKSCTCTKIAEKEE